METQTIVTPFYFDRPAPALERLGGALGAIAPPVINAPALPESDQPARLGVLHRALADGVAAAHAGGRRPVSIAGDCMQPAGVLAGLRRAGLDPVVVWLDAHGDFNTPETSPSGYVGGMPLAMLVGRGEAWLREQAGLALLDERDVILSDARDLDPLEAESLGASQVTIVRRVDEIEARLPASRPVYVHFDVDILDLTDAPAMMFPVPGGPAVSALVDFAARLHRTHDVVAVSMTTWELDRDEDGRTERACLTALRALIGA
jgi:arginase